MKPLEKIRIFKNAVVSAYREMNADRDLAELLLENAILIQNKYRLLTELCKNTVGGLCTIREEFSEFDEHSGSSLSKTLADTITVLNDYVTVKQITHCGHKLVSYMFCYDTTRGSAYCGIAEIFDRLGDFMDINIPLIKEKTEKRDFQGAIRQYIAMRDTLKSRCEENGIKPPKFSELNLDKYKNTEENDN